MSAPDASAAERWSANRVCLRVSQSLERHERLYWLLTLVIFTLAALYHDLTTPLWFDEFFTLFLSRLPSLPAMMQAMPADGQPPLQYLLTRISLQIFGESELGLRLPELLACLAAGLLVYRIVRRHGSAVVALFAMVLLFGAQQWQQALFARPYGLLLAFAALLFLAWQRAAEGGRRVWPLCLVAVAIAGAILSHHFGVIYAAILLGTGEVARLIQRRRLDGWMLLAIACGLLPLAITLPLAHASSVVLGNAVQHSAIFWAKPRLAEIFRYSRAVAWPLLAALALIAPLLWRKRAEFEPSPPADIQVPVHEFAAAGALSLILPLQLLLAHFVTGYFQPRYAIGTSLGLVLLIAWGLPRIRLLKPVVRPAMALATIGFLIVTAAILAVNNTRRPAWRPELAVESVPEALRDAPGDLPIVVASAYDYAPLWWYAPPAIRQRLIYLSDIPFAIRQQDFLPELSLAAGQQFIPLRITPFAPFLADHPRFLLYLTGQRRLEWVGPRLVRAGWHMKLVSVSGQRTLFELDRPDAH